MNLRPLFRMVQRVLSLLIFVYLFAILLIKTPLLMYPSYLLWDSLLTWEKTKQSVTEKTIQNGPIVLITVDEESAQKLQFRWPWSREVLALLLEKIAPYKPRVVSLDFAFFGRSTRRESDDR